MDEQNGMISRRSMLGQIPIAALSATVALPIAAAAEADAELLALKPLIQAAFDRWNAALEVANEAEKAFLSEQPEKPRFKNEFYRKLTGDEKVAYFNAWEPLSEEYEERVEQLRLKHRLDELKKACDPFQDAFDDLIYQLSTMRATTLAGFRLKAEMSEYSDEVSHSSIEDILAISTNA